MFKREFKIVIVFVIVLFSRWVGCFYFNLWLRRYRKLRFGFICCRVLCVLLEGLWVMLVGV